MSSKLAAVGADYNGIRSVAFVNPRNGELFVLAIEPHPSNPARPVWQYDGNAERPTIRASVLRRSGPGGKFVDHFFVTAGVVEYCGDCTHEHAGKSLPLEPVDLSDGFNFQADPSPTKVDVESGILKLRS